MTSTGVLVTRLFFDRMLVFDLLPIAHPPGFPSERHYTEGAGPSFSTPFKTCL